MHLSPSSMLEEAKLISHLREAKALLEFNRDDVLSAVKSGAVAPVNNDWKKVRPGRYQDADGLVLVLERYSVYSAGNIT